MLGKSAEANADFVYSWFLFIMQSRCKAYFPELAFALLQYLLISHLHLFRDWLHKMSWRSIGWIWRLNVRKSAPDEEQEQMLNCKQISSQCISKYKSYKFSFRCCELFGFEVNKIFVMIILLYFISCSPPPSLLLHLLHTHPSSIASMIQESLKTIPEPPTSQQISVTTIYA
jgi:hypothetical protein